MTRLTTYREPGVAGTFYSRDKLILDREMSMFLEAAPTLKLPRPIRAILVPHAGYLYSGGVSARAYSQLLNTAYRRILILAPSHQESFPFCSIYSGLGYKTPFGEIPLDEDLAGKLIGFSDQIRFSEAGHSPGEQAVEVQLPFLQWCLGKFRILPIVMGEQTSEQVDNLTRVLLKVLPQEDLLLVASSDLSHGCPDHQARHLDQIAIEAISKFDDKMLWREIQEGQAQLSGGGPVVVAMRIARAMGAREVKILLHRNSGDITGATDKVTGYLSAIFY